VDRGDPIDGPSDLGRRFSRTGPSQKRQSNTPGQRKRGICRPWTPPDFSTDCRSLKAGFFGSGGSRSGSR
jgi:hypothetical protein